jgi:hypothetical protein
LPLQVLPVIMLTTPMRATTHGSSGSSLATLLLQCVRRGVWLFSQAPALGLHLAYTQQF